MNEQLLEQVLSDIKQKKTITLKDILLSYNCNREDAFDIMLYLIKNKIISEKKDGVFNVTKFQPDAPGVNSQTGEQQKAKENTPAQSRGASKKDTQSDFDFLLQQIVSTTKQIEQGLSKKEDSKCNQLITLYNSSCKSLDIKISLSDTPLQIIQRAIAQKKKEEILIFFYCEKELDAFLADSTVLDKNLSYFSIKKDADRIMLVWDVPIDKQATEIIKELIAGKDVELSAFIRVTDKIAD